jgi:hypothetical protein
MQRKQIVEVLQSDLERVGHFAPGDLLQHEQEAVVRGVNPSTASRAVSLMGCRPPWYSRKTRRGTRPSAGLAPAAGQSQQQGAVQAPPACPAPPA